MLQPVPVAWLQPNLQLLLQPKVCRYTAKVGQTMLVQVHMQTDNSFTRI